MDGKKNQEKKQESNFNPSMEGAIEGTVNVPNYWAADLSELGSNFWCIFFVTKLLGNKFQTIFFTTESSVRLDNMGGSTGQNTTIIAS